MPENWLRALLPLAMIVVLTGVSEASSPQWHSAADFPLGIYWPGEFTYRDMKDPQARWQAIDRTLDLLKANHVTAVWLTHVSAFEGAEFAQHAGERGISLVASLGELSSENISVRKSDPEATVKRVLAAWGDAPMPIAWGLGDEPRSSYMHELIPLAKAWRKVRQPITTVVMPGDAPSAATLLPLTALCTDVYPFFGAGNPNGPDNHGASTAYFTDAGNRVRRWTERNKGMRFWMMGSVFQDAFGPHELDQVGNVVYLPGGGPNLRMPTSAEVRWETWAALAAGAKGVFLFALFYPARDAPNARPLGPDMPFGVKERTDSGFPGGMLYKDGHPTPQFQTVGECYGQIAKVSSILATLTPTSDFAAFHAKGWPAAGDLVQPFKAPDGSYYVLVVNGNVNDAAEVPVDVAQDTTDVTDLLTGISMPLARAEPFLQMRVKLAPGDGTLLRLNCGRAASRQQP